MHSLGSAEAGVAYPSSVYVVDSQAGYPLPAIRYPRRAGPVLWPLYVLLSLVLCGIVVEAGFIYMYQLHAATTTTTPSDVGSMAKMSQDRGQAKNLPARPGNQEMEPSKPTAHLTVGTNLPRADGIMLWDSEGDSIIHELDYKDGGLQIQREGFYFIYSKVSFTEPDCDMFTHTVLRRTPRALGANLRLMENRRSHCDRGTKEKELQSSYLGGVYHLVKGDIVLVKVESPKQIYRQGSYDNFFGAYMV